MKRTIDDVFNFYNFLDEKAAIFTLTFYTFNEKFTGAIRIL